MGKESRRGIFVEAGGAGYLFCDRRCAWTYFALGERTMGEPREGLRWGCMFCARGILDED